LPKSQTRPVSQTIGIYQAKTHLSRLIDRVEAGETIIISRGGRPVAELRGLSTLTPAEAVERLRAFRDRHLRAVPLLKSGETVRDLVRRGHKY
jgi:prevent-host-death family protein